MTGSKAAGFDISGALLAKGDFSNTDFVEAQLSKVYAEGAKFVIRIARTSDSSCKMMNCQSW